MLALTRDESIDLWDSLTGVRLTTLTGHGRTVETAAFSPDGGTLATSSTDGTVRLWKVPLPGGGR
ncbi:WD40 repeat domain-containing protein [Actinoplanes solisilvae]|uniref:WD40 repeat domain-containing protein n=1 Tax=Actinoplanes solisilvae TaxID=2486853 RepID=UPI0013E3F7E9|nr:hypothetical protein [Actinoplanes solisilvae]